MTSNIEKIILDSINKYAKKSNEVWPDDSKFKKIKSMQIDFRNRCGLEILQNLLSLIYNENDIIIKKSKKSEIQIKNKIFLVRISTQDNNKKFQAENVNEDYDGLIQLGITPNEILIKAQLSGEINNLHQRKTHKKGKGLKTTENSNEYINISNIDDLKKTFASLFK